MGGDYYKDRRMPTVAPTPPRTREVVAERRKVDGALLLLLLLSSVGTAFALAFAFVPGSKLSRGPEVGADPALADETGSSLDGEGEGEGERGCIDMAATSCDPIWGRVNTERITRGGGGDSLVLQRFCNQKN